MRYTYPLLVNVTFVQITCQHNRQQKSGINPAGRSFNSSIRQSISTTPLYIVHHLSDNFENIPEVRNHFPLLGASCKQTGMHWQGHPQKCNSGGYVRIIIQYQWFALPAKGLTLICCASFCWYGARPLVSKPHKYPVDELEKERCLVRQRGYLRWKTCLGGVFAAVVITLQQLSFLWTIKLARCEISVHVLYRRTSEIRGNATARFAKRCKQFC